MSETRRHVLVWVAPEFLGSSGMIRLFTEAGIFLPPEDNLDEYIHAAQAAGGFALTGRLVQANHGAGVFVSPLSVPGLELMIPWQFVKTIVTAEESQSSRIFGLGATMAQAHSAGNSATEQVSE
jgi:hypothetical protein